MYVTFNTDARIIATGDACARSLQSQGTKCLPTGILTKWQAGDAMCICPEPRRNELPVEADERQGSY
jgi:hypothetical protein